MIAAEDLAMTIVFLALATAALIAIIAMTVMVLMGK
jgi:hypothetical protein